MKEIELTHGYVALVDDEDFERININNFFVKICPHTNYACTGMYINKKSKHKFMHHLILNIKNARENKIEVDHIDGNGLNNQKHNLRICNKSQNCMNQKLRKTSTTKYKGVSWHKAANKFESHITINRKKKYLGLYNTDIEAAKVYDINAKELFGEYAYLNFKQ